MSHRDVASVYHPERTPRHATPDGYTFGQGNFSSLNTTRILMKLPYDTVKDLQPITFAYMSRNLLAINRTLPITSVPELIAHAKQHPRGPELIHTPRLPLD